VIHRAIALRRKTPEISAMKLFVYLGLLLAVRLGAATEPNALVWDAREKSYAAKPGEDEAAITFTVTNRS